MIRPQERIGYIRVTAFSRNTANEVRKVLKQLHGEKLRGLILDLRFNPGGLLGAAIEVSDLFVSKGRIVSTKGRNSPERVWDARKEGTFEDFPVVVLVNRYSASASEIVSACLQDQQRAVVMGERTWGKGSVQNVIELENGRSALKLTTAGYLRPSGKNIDRTTAKDKDEWGVTPDEGFELKLGDEEMEGLVLDLRRRDVLRPHRDNQGEEKSPPGEQPTESKENGDAAGPDGNTTKPPEEPAFVDRQLQMAVDYLAGKLARAG